MDVKDRSTRALVYLCVLVTAGLIVLLLWFLNTDSMLAMSSGPDVDFIDVLERRVLQSMHDPLVVLFAQLVFIISIARFCGRIARNCGQPAVIGEIVAGILLGPSLFGLFAPELQTAIFPRASLEPLRLFSQVGLVLFMFIVGMDLELSHVKKRADAAVVVSHASIVLPFLLGVGLSSFLFGRFAPADVPFLHFALFIGTALSITAFPVLARILDERRMSDTPMGAMALTCAAVDDVTAWFLLAVVVAVVQAASFGVVLVNLACVGLFVTALMFVVRPLLTRWYRRRRDENGPTLEIFSLLLLFLLTCALITEFLGVHALFGAFMAGLATPADPELRRAMRARLEVVSSVMLLPIFFAFTGLRTEIGLLNSLSLWLVALVVILVAIIGKLFGAYAAARMSGVPSKDAWCLGILMNSRGLMELVVLNIGYDLGLLTKEIFSIMVIMALVTTIMTGPLLELVRRSDTENDPGVVSS